jgi:Zn finger protein HypA/HybF involved in hydrogenase expression
MDTLNMGHKCWGCSGNMPQGDQAAYCPSCRKVINDEVGTNPQGESDPKKVVKDS